MQIDNLPNNIFKLKNLLIDISSKVEQKDHVIALKDREINGLKEMILLLQRRKYAPKSERDPRQSDMFNEIEAIADEVDDIEDSEEAEADDVKGGDEISEQLEITPEKITVKRIIRRKYALIDASSEGKILIESLPSQLLPKTMASSSLIAYIITAKYMDALPLYRQEKIFERIQLELTRQTMARWLIRVGELVTPLYNLLQDKMLARNYIQFDETPTQVLKEDGKKATSKSYMWARHSPGGEPIILFDYAPTRAGSVPLELLNGFSGYLQVDGYDGYSRACDEYDLVRVGCWDHCRRNFFDASKTSSGKGIGKRAVDTIRKLYDIEDRIKNLSATERQRIREEKSAPILKNYKKF